MVSVASEEIDNRKVVVVAGEAKFIHLPDAAAPSVKTHALGQFFSQDNYFAASPMPNGMPAEISIPDKGLWGVEFSFSGEINAKLKAIAELKGNGVRYVSLSSGIKFSHQRIPTQTVASLCDAIAENLPEIEFLHLSGSQSIFADTKPFEQLIANLKNLKFLHILSLPIDHSCIANHPSLESLSIVGDSLKATTLDSLDMLKGLNIQTAVEWDLPEKTLDDLLSEIDSLEYLYWQDYGIQRLQPDFSCLQEMDSLKVLSVWNTKPELPGLEALLRSQRILHLRLFQVSDEGMKLLASQGSYLKELVIENLRPLNEESRLKLAELTGLEILEIGGVDLTDELLIALSELPLTHLRISGNAVGLSDDAVRAFGEKAQGIARLRVSLTEGLPQFFQGIAKMTGIRRLDLSGQVDASNLKSLHNLEELDSLTISSKTFFDECAEIVSRLKTKKLVLNPADSLSQVGLKAILSRTSAEVLYLSSTYYLTPECLSVAAKSRNLTYLNLRIHPILGSELTAAMGVNSQGITVSLSVTLPHSWLEELHLAVIKKLSTSAFLTENGKYLANNRLPSEFSKITDGYRLKYLSNSSDDNTNDATKFVLVAYPLEFRKWAHVVYLDETGYIGTARIDSEKVLSQLSALKTEDIDFNAIENMRISDIALRFTELQ
ncbi:MAG: hypothetical protein U5N86_12010 [Planctomycetota bacterium]|nr:hypothetical protein [Planctomycetota bacterium]